LKRFEALLEMKMPAKDKKAKWYLKPVSVILSLFFILGPLGLPLLYRSPYFSKRTKVILTIAVIIYTIYLIFVSLELGIQLYKRFEELQEILR
jgi:O-antigen/teichoic acid export membrane protein